MTVKNTQALRKTYCNSKNGALEHSLNSQAAQKKETKHKDSQAVPNHLTWILFYIFYSELRLYRTLLSYCKKDMCNNWGKVILAQNWFDDK